MIKNCFNRNDIERLKSLFTSSLLNSDSSMPRQLGYRRLEKNFYSAEGHMNNAIMNMQLEHPSSYTKDEKLFTKLALKLITNGPHIALLKQTTGYNQLELLTWNLFHSVASGTPPHQDCVFFNPNAKLFEILGIWIALEDISPDSSPLYVQRYSHTKLKEQTNNLHSMNSDYVDFLERKLLENPSNVVAPLLKAGDCILWDSRTVHGSLMKINPQLSRLSITAHFTRSEESIIKKMLHARSKAQLSSIKKQVFEFREIGSYKTRSNVEIRLNKNLRGLLDF